VIALYIGGVEQTVERSAAGLHADGHRRLRKSILLHGGFDLIGEDLLDGSFLAFFQNALFGQKAIKRGADRRTRGTGVSPNAVHSSKEKTTLGSAGWTAQCRILFRSGRRSAQMVGQPRLAAPRKSRLKRRLRAELPAPYAGGRRLEKYDVGA
jgi:hypothetical protein